MAIPNGLMPFIDQSTMGSAFGSLPGVNRPQDAGQQQFAPLMKSQTPAMDKNTAIGLSILGGMGYSDKPQSALANIARGYLAGNLLHEQMRDQLLDRERVKVDMARTIEDARRARQEIRDRRLDSQRKRQQRDSAVASRRKYLESIPGLSKEMVDAFADNENAWSSLVAAQLRPPPKPEARWSEPYVQNIGNTPVLLKRNLDTGEVRSIGSGGAIGDEPKLSDVLLEGEPLNLGPNDNSEILDSNSVRRYINVNGQHPPAGSTVDWAESNGFVPVTAGQIAGIKEIGNAEAFVDTIEELAIGTDDNPGLLWGVEPGFKDLVDETKKVLWGRVTREDPRITTYEAQAKGRIISLVRALGEVGNIAQSEQQRAINLLPKVFPIPDTRVEAEMKIAELREILAKWRGRIEDRTFGPSRSAASSAPAVEEQDAALDVDTFIQGLTQ